MAPLLPQIHNGPPHSSNFGYSYAKRMIDVQNRSSSRACQAEASQEQGRGPQTPCGGWAQGAALAGLSDLGSPPW